MTKTAKFANSVDFDETAHYEPPHQDLHCFSSVYSLNSQYDTTGQNDCHNELFNYRKADSKFSSANFQKKIKSKLYHMKNSKTRGQTV